MIPLPLEVLRMLSLPRTGRIYDLEGLRERGMPIWSGHPPFQVLTYLTPQGIANSGAHVFPEPNDPPISLISDLVIGTTHSGTHVDALGHTVSGPEQRWHVGAAGSDLGDFGPLKGSASDLPIFFSRGVLIDVAQALGRVPQAGEPLDLETFTNFLETKRVTIEDGDAVLFRMGAGAFWEDAVAFAAHDGAGITLEVAEHLSDRGVLVVGGDTSTVEVQPSTVAGNPHPVHEHLLISHGIPLIENLALEELAADQVTEFLFIALPLKIRGATGSMLRPIAIT